MNLNELNSISSLNFMKYIWILTTPDYLALHSSPAAVYKAYTLGVTVKIILIRK